MHGERGNERPGDVRFIRIERESYGDRLPTSANFTSEPKDGAAGYPIRIGRTSHIQSFRICGWRR
jgi:hypothetical protein